MKQTGLWHALNDNVCPTHKKLIIKVFFFLLMFFNIGIACINANEDQQVVVTGKVMDSQTGEAMPGVNIVVKGTSFGAMTDGDGNYSISIPDREATLVFTFIGYIPQEVALSGQTTLDISMLSDVAQLSEVVVVGYGTVKKVNLTGAVSTVKFDEAIANRPITDASQALSGSMPGIWVSQNSGKPGSDAAQLRVRGWGTLNDANPLIIIDGIEGDLNQINPSDIENISVLKDAASAAIYGSKAANGVVLVTTKMGRNNERMRVSLNSYLGIQKLGMRYSLVSNSAENMRLSNQALANDGASPVYPDYLISAFENGTDPYVYPNTDWFDVVFKNRLIHEHNISIQGGTAQSSSYLSFNYLNHNGMISTTSSNRYGIRANIESNVKEWLRISGKFNYSRRVSKEPYADITYGSLGRVFDMLDGAVPFIAPYTRDGRFGSVQAIDDLGNLLYDNRNPLIDAANGQTKNEADLLSANATAEIKFTNNLSLITTLSTIGNWSLTDRWNESIYGYTDSGVETITKNYNREGIEANRRQISTLDNQLFTTLNYNKTFGEVHDISTVAGVQLEHHKIQNVYARRTTPPKEGLTQVDAGTTGIVGEGNMVGLRMFSYFGRLNYAYKSKYLFEANIRADASSRFAEENRWGIFPGFSLGWRLVDESFVRNLGVFSNLKLRASWGQLGNQSISGYWPYLTVINQSNDLSYSYAGSFAAGAAVTALIDENITWETTSTFDVGFEAGFLNNRLNIEADYFNKNTTDILVQLPIPMLLGGLTAPFENVGEMKNKGFEFSANYNSKSKGVDGFNYSLGLNLTYINNEVTKFQGGDSPDQTYLIREGYAYRTLYGFKAIGIYQSDAEGSEHMNANSYKPKAGELKFEDVNGDGKLGFEDKQGLGNTIPKVTFGLTSRFSFKGFDLNLLFQGIAFANMYIQDPLTNIAWENRTINVMWRDSWSPSNTDTNIPAIRYNNTWDNQVSSFWVKEISFLKLKNIQLGYSLPSNTLSKFGFQNLYVYLNVQNVFTIVGKGYDGWDPERNTFTGNSNMYPVPVITSFGINLNF
jgi:TonB-linked SusC/RagA family outer membrane protein